jgi:hypothetical protein
VLKGRDRSDLPAGSRIRVVDVVADDNGLPHLFRARVETALDDNVASPAEPPPAVPDPKLPPGKPHYGWHELYLDTNWRIPNGSFSCHKNVTVTRPTDENKLFPTLRWRVQPRAAHQPRPKRSTDQPKTPLPTNSGLMAAMMHSTATSAGGLWIEFH